MRLIHNNVSKRLTSFCPVGMIITNSLLGEINHSWATCVDGSQCKINDASMEAHSNTIFTSIGEGEDNAALFVTKNGSAFIGNNININANSFNHYAGFVKESGLIELNNSTINGDFGLFAIGSEGKTHLCLIIATLPLQTVPLSWVKAV